MLCGSGPWVAAGNLPPPIYKEREVKVYQPKMIAVEIRCLACHKDFYVKVDHPGRVLPAWQFHDHCPPCAANGGKKPKSKPQAKATQ